MSELVVPQVIRRFVFEEWGGTESVVWNTAKSLTRESVSAPILSTNALNPSPPGVENREGIPIHRFDYHYPYFNLNAQTKATLDKKGGNPYSSDMYKCLMNIPDLDLIHSHGMQRVAGLVRKVARKRNIPYVISFHGGYLDVPQSEIEDMKSSVKNCVNYGKIFDPFLGFHKGIDDADGMICVGYQEYTRVKALYPNKKVIYLPNGVNPEAFQWNGPLNFRKSFGIPEQVPLLLCVGRIDPQKNQDLLLELDDLLNLHDAHLALIGPATNTQYLERIKTAIQQKGLEKRVHLIGALKPDDPMLIQAYHSAQLMVLPSRHEPFGIVVLESWAAGLPVLVSDTGGLKHLVEHNHTGLKFQDLETLKLELNRFFSEPQLAQTLRENAHATLLSSYTWDTITKQLIDYYQWVIQEHSSK